MIYAIQAGDNGPIKFGYSSSDGVSRLRDLQTAHYLDLKLLHADEGDLEAEQTVHRICRKERIRGEWFRKEGSVIYVLRAMQEKRLQSFITRCWARDIVLDYGKREGESDSEFWRRRENLRKAHDLPPIVDTYALGEAIKLFLALDKCSTEKLLSA